MLHQLERIGAIRVTRNVTFCRVTRLDWNGDGEINGQDEHPFAFDQTPWLQFSLNAGLQWKNFDFNMLLQGSALGSMEYKEPLHEIWGKNGGGALTRSS